jgi:hypothetical protein
MKTAHKLLALLFTVCGTANAQVVPAATGPAGPAVNNKLQYALRYAETAEFAAPLPSWQTATASGSLEYGNGNERFPFSVDYGGGYTWTISGPSYASGQFQSLLLTQGLVWRKWTVTASDDASYSPQSPITGISGIPGAGGTIGVTSPAPTSGQTILTLNTHVVENNAIGEVTHEVNYATTLSAGGGSGLLRYPDGNGLDTNALTANAMVTRRLSGRNVLFGSYLYSDFSYSADNVTFQTNSGFLGYQRKWSRNLSTDLAAGPQWISSSFSSVVPNSVNVGVSADINYILRFTSASVSYSRGVNGGAGYLIGGEVDAVTGNFSRQHGTNLTIGLTGGYERTSGLNNNGVFDSTFGGAQGTWRIGRNIIVFANYTGTDQWSPSPLPTTLPPNTLNNLLQVVGFGVGYSPRVTNRRQ